MEEEEESLFLSNARMRDENRCIFRFSSSRKMRNLVSRKGHKRRFLNRVSDENDGFC